jgi:tetratricopeptide repeat protein
MWTTFHMGHYIPLTHSNWGLALARQGQLAEAIEHYQQAGVAHQAGPYRRPQQLGPGVSFGRERWSKRSTISSRP